MPKDFVRIAHAASFSRITDHLAWIGSAPRRRACVEEVNRVHFCHMGHTITVRLSKELADWLDQVASMTGVAQGKIIRDQLEKAKTHDSSQSFMRLAGAVRGPKDLSRRKGFARS